MNYPDRELVIETLLEVGRRAGTNCSADHPDDIAVAMVNAIESAGEAIQVLHENGRLTTQ